MSAAPASNSTPMPGAPAPALPASILAALQPDPGAIVSAGGLRALTVYATAPEDWGVALRIPDDRFAPHLRKWELALVDEFDLEPISGELFIVKIFSPAAQAGFGVKLVQLEQRTYPGRYGPTLGWWMHFDMRRRPGASGEEIADRLASGDMSLSEGPMNDGIRDRILGRVVGVVL